MTSRSSGDEIAARAAHWVVESGLEYGEAKRRAARELLRRGARHTELPSNEAVEAQVIEHLALFHGDTQPQELRALRQLALRWMDRLAEFRPHLKGAAWRGTATRRSALHLDLYCDDSKSAEIALLGLGVAFDAHAIERGGRSLPLLTLAEVAPELGEAITLHLLVHDHDDLRGALQPDAGGRRWRGDAAALRRLLQEGPT